MAIQYYMRAYNTTLSAYVDWIVNDAPDSIGTYSGYPTNQLTNITVNKVVQSKIENFLKPNQSLGGTDGYYFHANSYDTKNVTAPINPPSQLTGFAIERGINSVATVSGASNNTPIRITTSGAHGLTTGQYVTITGVQGNLAANGTFQITFFNATNFDLNNTIGSGTYTAGGTVYLPNNFSTLTWDEGANLWRFVVNTNGDGTTLGSSQQIKVLNTLIDGYAALGTNPSATGIIRLPNNQFINWRNATNTGDVQGVGVDNLNRIKIGNLTGDLVYMPGSQIVDGYIVHDGTGTNVPTIGFIREQNNTTIIAIRDAAGSNNISVLSSNNSNQITLGDAVNTQINYNTSTGNVHQFQINSVANFEIGTAFARFTAGVTAPTILQTTPGGGISGQTLTVQAQNGGTGTTNGGVLSLKSGTGSGAGTHGTVDIVTGSDGSSPPKIRVFATTAATAGDSNSILFSANLFRIATAQVLPRIRQDDTASASATNLTIQAQNSTNVGGTGGNILVTSGSGAATAGNLILQTGGVNRIIVTPTLTTILGNLLVNGTTTSIDSTVVEIRDRAINLNSSANQFPGTVVPVPSQITGMAIDRGSPDGIVKRDYYGLFWTETDGYWKFAINTDGYTAQNTLTGTLPLIVSAAMAQPSAAVPVDATKIPTVGGFRSLNNTVHSAARNAASTQDLILVSTDGTNHLIWGAPTQNAGHIFNTSLTTIYDFQVNSVSTYTITPISNGTTTLQATAGVTALVYTQTTTGGATGANTTMSAQSAATTGGNLILSSGAATTAGNVQIQTGAVDRVVVHPTFTEFRDAAEALRITPVSAGTTQITYASTVTAAQINQTATGGATGATMTVQAQNAATTGGALTLTSGTGTTAGDVNIQTGAVSKVIVHPTFTEFRDTAEALRITPVSAGTSQVTFAATVTAVSFNHTATAGATGAPWTIQAQTGASGTGGNLNLIAGNATTTGGNAIITSGTGTTAGNVQLQTGAVDRVIVHPTFTEFRDAAEAFRVTPVSAGSTSLQFASTVTAARLFQADLTTNSGTGATLTVQAQHETGTTSTGGDLNLTSGTGTTTNGTVNLQVGTVTTASLVTNKFVLNAGKRRHITTITTTYPVVATDDYIAITTLAAPFTITLPATPTVGDEYTVKDTTGNAGTSTVTVDGNGSNIDGAATFLMNQPYAAATFTYINGQWSVS